MKAIVNDNASGILTAIEGIEVEIINYAPNGYAAQVKMPEKPKSWPPDAYWPSIKRPWLPTSWLTMEEES